jgi:type II secretory pathway component GspD/PulD (secretin)
MALARLSRFGTGIFLAGFLALSLGIGSGVATAGEADPETYRALDIGDGLVTLDVQDALFGDVVRERIQPRTRVNIVVSPEAAEQKVTLRVVDLHWVQALDAMAEKVGAILVRKATNLLKIERPSPVTMSFQDEDVRKVIKNIADFASANVIVSEKVKGTITISLNGTPWRESLEQVVRTVGFALVEEEYGILRIVPLDELELESGFYRFRFARPPAPYRGVIADQAQGSSGGAGGGGGGGGGGSAAPKPR